MKTLKSLFGSDRPASAWLQRRWLALAGVTVLGSAALLALALDYLRGQTVQAAEHLNTALAHIVAEQTTRTLQTVSQRLELTATSLALMDGPGESNPESVGKLLQSQLAQLPFVLSLWVLDAQGDIAFAADAASTPRPGNTGGAERKPAHNYADLFAQQPESRFAISLPQPGRAPGLWSIQAARPVLTQNGATTGFVVAVLDAHHFDALWSQMDLGTDGSVVLARRDGTVLLRVPPTASAMGTNRGNRPVFQTLLPASPTGTFRDRSAVDGVDRLYAYSTLAAQAEMVVVLGRSESHVLARWRQWTTFVLWVWGGGSAIILVLGFVLDRTGRRLDREQRNAFENATRYQDTLQDNAQKLQALSRRIINAQEAERRRVAHELHDELGQSLTAIKINLQSGARFKNRTTEETNQENIRIVEDALQQVRSLALTLRPAILDNLGLVPALGWLGKQMAQRAGFVFDFVPPAQARRLAPELETTCFRIVQEALTNIARHAQARHVDLSMEYGPDSVSIELHDDGVGMDWNTVLANAQSGASAGVLGMLERAALVGGSLQVRSSPGAGCTLVLHCPLQLQPQQP